MSLSFLRGEADLLPALSVRVESLITIFMSPYFIASLRASICSSKQRFTRLPRRSDPGLEDDIFYTVYSSFPLKLLDSLIKIQEVVCKSLSERFGIKR